MSANQRTWLMIGFFVVCLFVGWAVPFIWLLFIVALIILSRQPTQDQTSGSVATAVPNHSDEIKQLVEELQIGRLSIQDDAKRSGFDDALAIVQRHAAQLGAVTPAQIAQSPQPVVTSPEDLAKHKAKQDQQNTNTLLYVASFLLVGAAVLFIGTGLDPVAKFVGLLAIAAGFYWAGIWLYRGYPKLHPAAIAFVGTGLALVPFVGLAFNTYIVQDGSLSWFLTSLIGLAMFMYATVMIRNQTLAYLTSGFVFSLTASSVSVLTMPFVWYFVTIIITGSLLGYIAYKKPAWLPADLYEPFEKNGMLAVPVAIVGSLLIPGKLGLAEYELLTAVAALHFLIGSLGFNSIPKLVNWSLARGFMIILALLVAYDVTDSYAWVGTVLAATAIVTAIYSYLTSKQLYENLWMLYAQFAVVISLFLWAPDWNNVALGLGLLALISFAQFVQQKGSEYSIGLLIAVLALPTILVYGVLSVAESHQLMSLLTILLAIAAILFRYALNGSHPNYVSLAIASYGVLLAQSLIAVFLTANNGWIASVVAVVAAVIFVASYIERQPLLTIATNILTIISVTYLFLFFAVDPEWRWLTTAWVVGIGWYALRWYYDQNQDGQRRDIMLASALAALLLGSLFAMYDTTTVIAACLTALVAAGLIAYEGYRNQTISYYEVALVVASFALQRLIAESYDPNILFYTHWWAAVIAVAAWLRFQRSERDGAAIRGKIALGFLSIPTGLMALGNPEQYQLLFLGEHLVLLMAGYLNNKKFIVQWAAAGIAVALIWMLKEYTYVLLALIAFGLIGLAVWRLNKK